MNVPDAPCLPCEGTGDGPVDLCEACGGTGGRTVVDHTVYPDGRRVPSFADQTEWHADGSLWFRAPTPENAEKEVQP